MPDFGSWTPKALGPYAWYDAHLGGYATGIRDTSAYGRPDATLGAGSNAPAWLPWEGQPKVYLSGVAGCYVACPDAFNITGDMEVVVCLSLDDWTPAANNTIVGQYNTSGQRAWRLFVTNAGSGYVLRFSVSADGSATLYDFSSSVAPTVADGQFLWIKFTLDADDGASGSDGRFYTAADQVSEPTSWNQLGSTAHRAATTSIFNSPAQLEIGGINGATTEPMTGRVRRAIVRNGIGGSTVADFNADLCSQTGYTDAFGNVWTVSRPTAGRKAIVQSPVASSTRGLYLLGTDDFIAIPGAALPPTLASSNNTFVFVARMWNTPVSFGRIFSTQPTSTSADRGVYIVSSSATTVQGRYADGTTLNGVGSNNFRNGLREVWGLVAWASGQSFTLYQSEQNLGTVTLASVGDRSSAGARIGSNLNGTSFSDLEFEALLTFDRGLTTAEVAQLNAYYRGGL